MESPKKKIYRLVDLVKRLDRNKTSLLRWEAEGKIPTARRDNRGWRYYTPEDFALIVRFVEENFYFSASMAKPPLAPASFIPPRYQRRSVLTRPQTISSRVVVAAEPSAESPKLRWPWKFWSLFFSFLLLAGIPWPSADAFAPLPPTSDKRLVTGRAASGIYSAKPHSPIQGVTGFVFDPGEATIGLEALARAHGIQRLLTAPRIAFPILQPLRPAPRHDAFFSGVLLSIRQRLSHRPPPVGGALAPFVFELELVGQHLRDIASENHLGLLIAQPVLPSPPSLLKSPPVRDSGLANVLAAVGAHLTVTRPLPVSPPPTFAFDTFAFDLAAVQQHLREVLRVPEFEPVLDERTSEPVRDLLLSRIARQVFSLPASLATAAGGAGLSILGVDSSKPAPPVEVPLKLVSEHLRRAGAKPPPVVVIEREVVPAPEGRGSPVPDGRREVTLAFSTQVPGPKDSSLKAPQPREIPASAEATAGKPTPSSPLPSDLSLLPSIQTRLSKVITDVSNLYTLLDSKASYASTALTNRINRMENVTFIAGTNAFNLRASDIPGLDYLAIGGGTLTGPLIGTSLTLSGDLTVSGTQSLSGRLTIPSFAATSTTATSTIAYGLTVGDQGGMLGIGTTSPQARLAVAGLGANASRYIFLASDSASTTRFAITESGLVGIGTTTPSEQLALSGRLYVGGSATSTFENNLHVRGNIQVGSGTSLLTGQTLGVGSSSPTVALGLVGSGYLTGGLGVGFATTGAGQLHVTGNATFDSEILMRAKLVSTDTGTSTFSGGISAAGLASSAGLRVSAGDAVFAGGLQSAGVLNITGSGSSLLSGSLGIATSSPGTALGVTGAGAFSGHVAAKNFFATSTSEASIFPIASSTSFSIADRLTVSGAGASTFAGSLGIATGTPGTSLGVTGPGVFTGHLMATQLIATSTTATSSISGGLTAATGGGSVGIGTSSPAKFFSVAGDAIFGGNATSTFQGNLHVWGSFVSGKSSLSLGENTITSSGALGISAGGANALNLSTNGVERLRIDSAGLVGIGTSSPGSLLSVDGGGLLVRGDARITGPLNIASLIATSTLTVTSTATSTFSGGISAAGLASSQGLTITAGDIRTSGGAKLGTTTATNLDITNTSTSTFSGGISTAGFSSSNGLTISGGPIVISSGGINVLGSGTSSYSGGISGTSFALSSGLTLTGGSLLGTNIGATLGTSTFTSLTVSNTSTSTFSGGVSTAGLASSAGLTVSAGPIVISSGGINVLGTGTSTYSGPISATGLSLSSGLTITGGSILGTNIGATLGTSTFTSLTVSNTSTSTFSGGISAAGLASSAGLRVSAGDAVLAGGIQSAGTLNITSSATSTYSGGITATGFSTTNGLAVTSGTLNASGIGVLAATFGVGTTSPGATLGVSGEGLFAGTVAATRFNATSSIASIFPVASTTSFSVGNVITVAGAGTSTFSGGISGTSLGLSSGLTLTGGDILASNISVKAGTSTFNSLLVALGGPAAPSYTFSGDLDTGLYSPGANLLAISTGGSERVRVDSTGQLGIATTSPTTTFSVTGSGYLTGGLGVGFATTGAGQLHVTGAATFENEILALGKIVNTSSGTSTFSGGISAAGLASSAGLRVSAGDAVFAGGIQAAGSLNITSSATSTYSGGISATSLALSSGLTLTGGSLLGTNIGATLGTSTFTSFTVSNTSTSTFSGGVSTAGLASSAGLRISAGDAVFAGGLQSAGILNITGTATSTYTGGISSGGLSVGTSSASALYLATFGNPILYGGTGATSTNIGGEDIRQHLRVSSLEIVGACAGCPAGSPAGATGQVQFNSSGSFAANASLSWDNTNLRLGIATGTPGTSLGVTGAGVFAGHVTAKNFFATSTSEASIFPIASTTSFSVANVLTVSGAGTSTYTGGISLGGGGLASSAGLTLTGGDILASNISVKAGTSTLNSVFAALGGPGAPSYSFTGDANTGIYSSGADTLNFTTGGSERVRIDSSGNVGIGTTSPWGLLSVNPSGITGTAMFAVGSSTATQFVVSNENGRFGNVGIGTTSPASLFSVGGAGYFTGNVGVGRTPANDLIHAFSSAGGAVIKAETTASSDAAKYTMVAPTNGYGQISFDDTTAEQGFIQYNHNTDAMTFDTNNLVRVTITSTGNVGIGTTSPGQVLSVAGNIIATGCLKHNVNTTLGTCVDIAEAYVVGEELTPGTIVAVKPDAAAPEGFSVVPATTTMPVLGVISTRPAVYMRGDDALFGGSDFTATSTFTAGSEAPLALAGRVPVKVSTESGPIKIGDRITSSSLPGIGMKATTSGQTVGIALEPFNGSTATTTATIGSSSTGSETTIKTGKILVFINLGYAKLDSQIASVASGDLAMTGGIWSVDQQTGRITTSYGIDLKGKDIIGVRQILSVDDTWRIDEFGNLTAASVTTKKLCLDDVCIEKEQLRALLQNAGLMPSSSAASTGLGDSYEVQPRKTSQNEAAEGSPSIQPSPDTSAEATASEEATAGTASSGTTETQGSSSTSSETTDSSVPPPASVESTAGEPAAQSDTSAEPTPAPPPEPAPAPTTASEPPSSPEPPPPQEPAPPPPPAPAEISAASQ